MYQFYESPELEVYVQVYSEGEITEEYAKRKIDNLTEGKSELFEPVCLFLDMFGYTKAVLPFSISDKVMKVWKFDEQTLNTSRTYKKSAVLYKSMEPKNKSNKVDLVKA